MSSKPREHSCELTFVWSRAPHNANGNVLGHCHGDGCGLDCATVSACDHPTRRQARYAFHAHAIVTSKMVAEELARYGLMVVYRDE